MRVILTRLHMRLLPISIVKKWQLIKRLPIDNCVKETVKKRIVTETHGIRFMYESGFLFIVLPSGRRLAYVKPKFCENITQAIAKSVV